MIRREIFVALTLVALLGCARSGATEGLKAPASYFDIRGSVPESINTANLSIHKFRAGPNGLYFCISSSPNTLNSVVLETGWNGGTQAIFTPPSDQAVMDFDIDGRGNLYVLMSGHGKSSLLVYGPGGQVQSTVAIGYFASGLSVANGKPVLLLPDPTAPKLEVLDTTGPRDLSIQIKRTSPAPAMTSLPDGRVVVADKVQGTVYLVDVTSESTVSFDGGMRSIRSGAAPPSVSQTSINRVALNGAAASPEGEIYIIGGGYHMAAGAPVSHFDSQGTLLESIRCTLPTFEDMKDPDNPEGFMLPNSVGVHDRYLFLVSPQGKVATYAR